MSLLIVPSTGQTLSPAQRRFNQLVRKIDRLRADLQAWEAAEIVFIEAWAGRVSPARKELADCRYALVFKLNAMLGSKGWTRTERQTLRELLCGLAAGLIDDDDIDDARAAELKVLHDAHAELDFDTAAAEDMADMKDLFEYMSGIDLGDDPVASRDELLRRAFEQMQRQAQAEQAPPAEQRKKPSATAAQRRRQREEQDAAQSLREVFRKLASALHPDRAEDEDDRQRRTALMQRVNQAYERQDLLALFALQLEIEQIDAEHLANATAEKARHYNRMLDEQARDLQAELFAREAALQMRHNLDPGERLNARKLPAVLARETQVCRTMLLEIQRDLRGLDDRAYARRWLRERRQDLLQAAQDDMPLF